MLYFYFYFRSIWPVMSNVALQNSIIFIIKVELKSTYPFLTYGFTADTLCHAVTDLSPSAEYLLSPDQTLCRISAKLNICAEVIAMWRLKVWVHMPSWSQLEVDFYNSSSSFLIFILPTSRTVATKNKNQINNFTYTGCTTQNKTSKLQFLHQGLLRVLDSRELSDSEYRTKLQYKKLEYSKVSISGYHFSCFYWYCAEYYAGRVLAIVKPYASAICPSTRKIVTKQFCQYPVPSKAPIFNQYSLVAPQP